MKILRHLAITTIIVAIIAGVIYVNVFKGIGSGALAENIRLDVYNDSLLKNIPVSLDASVDNKIYVVETASFHQGVGDNRQQAFWFMDDMASMHVDDRLAYIKKWIAKGELTDEWFLEGKENVVVIEDKDGDGVGDKATLLDSSKDYLDGVISGILVHGEYVYVTNIPHVWRYKDADGDLVPEEKESLSYGYGLRANFLGHDLHGLTWGPDGKIYYSIGDRGYNIINQEGKQLVPEIDPGRGAVFRMNPDGSDLEVFAHGLRNPQELAFDNYGNLFTGDNNSDGGDSARIVYVAEDGDSGWLSPYQYQTGLYLRGAWNAEKLWFTQHEGQPAWILPPVAHLTNGPAGFAHYPGIGLSERYNNHFFLSDYAFTQARSKMWSFQMQPKGAGFKIDDTHVFADQRLFIDQNFGYDGKLYAITASVFDQDATVLALYDETQVNNESVTNNQKLWQQGLNTLASDQLVGLLENPDQRMRLQAQFELAKREDIALLQERFSKNDEQLGELNKLARIHSLWGLSQIGSKAFSDESWTQLHWLKDEDDEIKAQVLKAIGESGVASLQSEVASYVGHNNGRVAYFAAMASGKLKNTQALDQIVARIKSNNNEDVFLRHALVFALSKVSESAYLESLSLDSSAALRLAAVLALRKQNDVALKAFLSDADDAVYLEAVRAIHDLNIEGAMPTLAQQTTADRLNEVAPMSKNPFVQIFHILRTITVSPAIALEFWEIIKTVSPLKALSEMYAVSNVIEDKAGQSTYAFHRRVINANLKIGDEASALRLKDYILDESKPVLMRALALRSIENFTQPPMLDEVLGNYKAYEERDFAVVKSSLDILIPTLLEDPSYSAPALQLALKYEYMPFTQQVLFDQIGADKALEVQIISLRALAQKALKEQDLSLAKQAVEKAMKTDEVLLRAEALDALLQWDQEAALAMVEKRLQQSRSIEEKQRALKSLQKIDKAEDLLRTLVNSLQAGEIETALVLDVQDVLALAKNAEIALSYNTYQQEQIQKDPVAQRQYALAGGNQERGEQVFESNGDCLRCHQVNGKGGLVGPDLTDVADAYDMAYLLDALVLPGKDIAPGFGIKSVELNDGVSLSGTLISSDANKIILKVDTGHGDPVEKEILKTDIASESTVVSGMPPMGLILPAHDLRDVMAYMATLK